MRKLPHLLSFGFGALIFLALATSASGVDHARAQSAPTAITVGRGPIAVAVNPTSERVYVANEGSNTVSVVDATTDQLIATIPVGRLPSSVAINPMTNRIYVASLGANSLSVIDGARNRASSPYTEACSGCPVAR